MGPAFARAMVDVDVVARYEAHPRSEFFIR